MANNPLANMMGGMFPGMNMLNKSGSINVGGMSGLGGMMAGLGGGGGNAMPDISQLLANMGVKLPADAAAKVPEFMNHRRATQTIPTSSKTSATTASPSNSADVTTSGAWVYLVLWYLIQQFVTNNTTRATLMRPPGSVAVADHFRNLFPWIVFIGAIAWIVLSGVILYMQHNVDDLSMVSGVVGRLFTG